eukprot:506611-Pyramimonas_sp.AAC.1
MVYTVAKKYGTERFIGPAREGSDWQHPSAMAEAAVDASRQKPVREARCILSRAWATFAHAAEKE